jgi:hypothetical protein
MKKSLKAYAHMTKDVVHGDCRALFNAVILQNNPEPRQLLVRCFQQLVKHEKTAAEPYQPWVTTLHNIYNALDTVDFPLAPHVRLGFMMALLGSDKRYTPILEKAQEKEWEIEKCQIHFDRHATKLNDQINPFRIPLPVSHSANAIISDPAYPNPTPESDGEQGGDAEWGETDSEGAYNYPNPTTPDGEQEGDTDPEETDNQQQHQPSAQEIAAINLQLEKALAYRNAKQTQYRTSNPKNTKRRARSYQHQPCLNYSEGRECYYDPCPYNHLIGPDEAHSPSVPVTPATAPTPAAAELNKSYSHTVNMVLSSWAAGSVVMIDKLLTSGVPNVTTTILSSKVVKQPNGKSPRFYSVALPTAHLDMLHEQFAYMAETGIHEDFLKLHVVAPNRTQLHAPSAATNPAQSHTPSAAIKATQTHTPSAALNSTQPHAPSAALKATQPHTPSAALNQTQPHTPSAALNESQPHTRSAALNQHQPLAPSAAHESTKANAPSATHESTKPHAKAAATTTTNVNSPLSAHLRHTDPFNPLNTHLRKTNQTRPPCAHPRTKRTRGRGCHTKHQMRNRKPKRKVMKPLLVALLSPNRFASLA